MQRDIEEKLKTWQKQAGRKPLILQGARQTGKTYSLKKFGVESFSKHHYLNFEKDEALKKVFAPDLNPGRILQEINFYVNASINTETDLIIFDEIQACPQAITSLKYFAEEMPQLAICAAGSLLGLHLNQTSFPVGKVNFLHIYPLSFEEFLLGIGDTKTFEFLKNYAFALPIPEIIHNHLWQTLIRYFAIGGLPEVVLAYKNYQSDLYRAFDEIRVKQSDLILSYLADMAKHSGKENASHIQRLWENIPAQLAKEQNGSAPKFQFKGVIPNVQGFGRLAGAINWLKATGLIIPTYIINKAGLPFTSYVKENFFKLYFFDVGLLGATSKLNPKTILDYNYGSYKGYYAENFIAQEFLASGQENFFCWQENTAEVEFLREVDGDILPIEVKSGGVTQTKSLKVYAHKYNPKFRTIFSAGNVTIDKTNKVYRLPLYLASKFDRLNTL